MRINPNTGALDLECRVSGPCFEPLTALTFALSAASGLMSSLGTIAGGNAAKSDAEFQAKQLEQKGNEERAIGQRQMFERRREKELVQSSLIARAGAGGGDTSDTGVLNLAGDIEQRGELQALTEFYRGENAARGYMDSAEAARAKGAAAQSGSRLRAFGSILETGSSLASKYGPRFRSDYERAASKDWS